MGGDWAIYPIAFFVCMILSQDILGGADKEPVSITGKWWMTDRRRFLMFWLLAWLVGGGLWFLSQLQSGPL
jgi:hypothetical protein